jgi:hypothetical protein
VRGPRNSPWGGFGALSPGVRGLPLPAGIMTTKAGSAIGAQAGFRVVRVRDLHVATDVDFTRGARIAPVRPSAELLEFQAKAFA